MLQTGCLPYFYICCGPSANLECRSEMCCMRLTGNAGPKNHTTLSAYIFDNRKKQLVKQQYLLQMSPQYGELRPTTGWDRSGSLGHPCKFQRVSRLGSITARNCSSGRQPNVTTLNRGHHLYSAGRPSRWALAHISSCICVLRIIISCI